MNLEIKKNNSQNLSEPSLSKKDNILKFKPESFQKEFLYFKEEALKEIKHLEKNLIQKSQEANERLKESLTTFGIKINLIKDSISSLSNKLIESNKNEEKIENLYKLKQECLEWTGTNKIKISLLEKDTRASIDRINELLKNSIIYPGIIGNKSKFNNFHEFIDFLLSESKDNSSFRLQNITDLTNFKLKIDKNMQTLIFKVETSLNKTNSLTQAKIKEVQDRIDYALIDHKKDIEEVKIQNADYVIQLEKDTKDLREEIKNIKILKKEMITRIDEQEQSIKKENEKIMDNLKQNREEIDILKSDIVRIDKKIEELMQKFFGILFDSQKRTNESLGKIKHIYNENKKDVESKINDIKNNINEENSQIINSIKEINDKLYKIYENDPYLGGTNENNKLKNDINNNIDNNEAFNKVNPSNNYTFSQRKINNNSANRKIKIKNLINNNNGDLSHTVNVNKINIKSNLKRMEMEKDQNINHNLNGNFTTKNQNSIFYNINNNTINKNILENLKINKVYKLSRNQNNSPNNNINGNIVSPSLSFQSKSSRGNNLNNNLNIKKLSSALENNKIKKEKIQFKMDEEKDNDNNNNYKGFLNNKKNIYNKRLSFNNEKIETLKNFQKILKMNINDIDVKLNDFNNNSTSSFRKLKENKEINDRFYSSNFKRDFLIEKYLNNKNDKNIINLLNINGKTTDKNSNDDNSDSKNKLESKTLNYFYHRDPNKKINKGSFMRPDYKNIIKLKKNSKLGLYKYPNSEMSNMKRQINRRIIGSNSLIRLHNYFIGFYDNDFEDSKKKKKKINYKSLSSRNKIFDDKKDNNKKIISFFGNKNK